MKKYLRISLKLFLLVLTVIAIVLAWQVNLASRRKAAIEAVKASESYVQSVSSQSGGKQAGSSWLRKFLGDEYFVRIDNVHGQYSKLSDQHLAVLSKLPELKSVSTNRSHMGSLVGTLAVSNGLGTRGEGALISDVGLTCLSKAKHLEALILFNTTVSDAGISSLTKLKKLKMLMVASPNITDLSVEHFSKMKSLERLWVPANISLQGVEALKKQLPECEITTREDDDNEIFF